MLAVIFVLVVEVSASSLVDIAVPESVPPVCLIDVIVTVSPSTSVSFNTTSPVLSPLSFTSLSVPYSAPFSTSVVSVEFS